MKCPKCNYVSHDYLDACRKCGIDLVTFKQDIGLVVLQPGALDLSLVLGGSGADDLFESIAEDVTMQVSDDDDFDISLDDYAEHPEVRRPGRSEPESDLADMDHLTLALDAADLPDPDETPGRINPDVTAENIQDTICVPGFTKTIRPPAYYTTTLKKQQLKQNKYPDKTPAHYEEDHLISLELGGDGRDPKNLWPEPHLGTNNSFEKDKVENWLHKQICSGAISVTDAQHGISTNWRQYIVAANGEKLSHKERQ